MRFLYRLFRKNPPAPSLKRVRVVAMGPRRIGVLCDLDLETARALARRNASGFFEFEIFVKAQYIGVEGRYIETETATLMLEFDR